MLVQPKVEFSAEPRVQKCVLYEPSYNDAALQKNVVEVKIDERDGCSKYVCWNCCMHINLLSMFIEKCVQKNETLKGAAGSFHSQQSQSSCMSEAGCRGGSFCEEMRRPDWLSLSFSSKGDSAVSNSATPMADLSARPSKEELKKTTIKIDHCKRKKISPHNKENRCKIARRHAKAGSSPDVPSWKVGRLNGAARADDSTSGRYNLRKNTRVSQHVATPSTSETGKSSRQTAKTRRQSSLQNQSREPLLIFSQNAAQTEDEDAHSGKTGSEFNFALDTDEIETPKKGSQFRPASWKVHSEDLLWRSPGPGAEADVSSLLDCSRHQNPLQRTSKDQQNSGKRAVLNENFLGGKHCLGMQSQYPYDEDLSTQFARRHLSFVC